MCVNSVFCSTEKIRNWNAANDTESIWRPRFIKYMCFLMAYKLKHGERSLEDAPRPRWPSTGKLQHHWSHVAGISTVNNSSTTVTSLKDRSKGKWPKRMDSPPGQCPCSSSHSNTRDSHSTRHRIHAPSTIFTWSSTMRFLHVPTSENILPGCHFLTNTELNSAISCILKRMSNKGFSECLGNGVECWN